MTYLQQRPFWLKKTLEGWNFLSKHFFSFKICMYPLCFAQLQRQYTFYQTFLKHSTNVINKQSQLRKNNPILRHRYPASSLLSRVLRGFLMLRGDRQKNSHPFKQPLKFSANRFSCSLQFKFLHNLAEADIHSVMGSRQREQDIDFPFASIN